MKGTMPKKPDKQQELAQAPLGVSPEEANAAVDRFAKETDWDEFWSRVNERASSKVDAYEKARVRSLQTASRHVFS